MSSAVTARWHGDDYQARVFWEMALGLLRPNSPIKSVTFEADGPKAFDDVVVYFNPPIARASAERIHVDYMQVKWHVASGGRFGYADLIDPNFISANSVSLLQRLAQAVSKARTGSCFTFFTTDRIADGDPLGVLVSGNDGALRLDKLLDGKTDRSKMGKVRALWRKHLALDSDEALRTVLASFRIMEGSPSLDRMKASVVISGAAAGIEFDETKTDFRPDQLARQLKVRKINRLDQAGLLKFLGEEGIPVRSVLGDDTYHPIAVRSFVSASADILDAAADDTLLVTDQFKGRYLLPEFDWRRDVESRITDFLLSKVPVSPRLRLVIDGHASIAWLAGRVLDIKSGVTIELMQKGRPQPRRWRADDGSSGPLFSVKTNDLGGGEAIAVAISVAQDVGAAVTKYVAAKLPEIGRIIHFTPPNGIGHQAVQGGAHAVQLAEQIAQAVRIAKVDDLRAPVHIFAACPNALLFYLGQNHQSYAPSTMYEFDFDGAGNGTYSPSF